MSVTFMPAGNMEYCDANSLTEKTVYDCQCVDFPEMFPADGPPCRDCGGKGKVEFPAYPFEANLANGNAHAVQAMLGMPLDYCGECGPQTILDGIAFVKALNATGCDPLVTPTTEEGGKGSVRIIHCGRTQEQIDRYLEAFEGIAMEAARRKVNVVWG